jgi:hypothetical protein
LRKGTFVVIVGASLVAPLFRIQEISPLCNDLNQADGASTIPCKPGFGKSSNCILPAPKALHRPLLFSKSILDKLALSFGKGRGENPPIPIYVCPVRPPQGILMIRGHLRHSEKLCAYDESYCADYVPTGPLNVDFLITINCNSFFYAVFSRYRLTDMQSI